MENSLYVDQPEIPEVLDRDTGEFVSLAKVVGDEKPTAIQLRTKIVELINDGNPRFLCAECYVPVKLLAHHISSRFYFKHIFEDGRCSAQTKGLWSQVEINARKYNGAKESQLHLNMKQLVAESLVADPRFSEIKIEKRWKGRITPDRRQPDVQALYRKSSDDVGVRIAFEIQLSTTFLDVLVGRRQFYQREGGLLIWIFTKFPTESRRRLTQDDIFYNNNQNAFIVDRISTDASITKGELHLSCIWSEPGTNKLSRCLIPFSTLTLNLTNQQVFYFDYYGKASELNKNKTDSIQRLRDQFEKIWLMQWVGTNVESFWSEFRRELYKVSQIPLPLKHYELDKSLLNALYSLKHGRIVGWDYNKLIEVGHHIASHRRHYLRIIGRAIRIYGREKQIENEDISGKWKERVSEFKAKMKVDDPAYKLDIQHRDFIAFLFPELFNPLN